MEHRKRLKQLHLEKNPKNKEGKDVRLRKMLIANKRVSCNNLGQVKTSAFAKFLNKIIETSIKADIFE